MTVSRLLGRRGDGSAVVRGWVAVYTLGLPAAMRTRRRHEVAGDLADETLDAVRRGETAELRGRRLSRWLFGIPDDLAWRFVEAPSMARQLRARRGGERWTPPSRMALALLALAAIGTAGALTLIVGALVSGRAVADTWLGWGPYGFVAACVLVLVAVPVAVPWPRRGLGLTIPAVVIGLAAAPWLWGCWFIALFALAVRWYQADDAGTAGVAGGAR